MDLGAFGQWEKSRRLRARVRAGWGIGLRPVRMCRRAVRARREGARGVGGCVRARARARGKAHVGPSGGREQESSVPPRQSPSRSLSSAALFLRGARCARKRLQEKGDLSSPSPGAALRKPAWPHQASLTSRDRENRWLSPVKAGQFVLKSFVHRVLGFLIQAEKNFEVRKIATLLVSIGSALHLVLQTTMKNQDKKNGTAKQSGSTSNPKSNPGQAEAGVEGAQGLPNQSASATEAEGSTSQAPGKSEGMCQLSSSSGQGEGFVVSQSSFWSWKPLFPQKEGSVESGEDSAASV